MAEFIHKVILCMPNCFCNLKRAIFELIVAVPPNALARQRFFGTFTLAIQLKVRFDPRSRFIRRSVSNFLDFSLPNFIVAYQI